MHFLSCFLCGTYVSLQMHQSMVLKKAKLPRLSSASYCLSLRQVAKCLYISHFSSLKYRQSSRHLRSNVKTTHYFQKIVKNRHFKSREREVRTSKLTKKKQDPVSENAVNVLQTTKTRSTEGKPVIPKDHV